LHNTYLMRLLLRLHNTLQQAVRRDPRWQSIKRIKAGKGRSTLADRAREYTDSPFSCSKEDGD